eukprot:TRINITY_DN443_c2_g1_i1.p1 TRINITY_DN443_c2_g1~~TRINITY_DN443_c2_g1_i1.p1  ORF type:complete len:382 (+),score=137.46 TRINITY_DN443_c2_g1_i1:17-1162(+)
MKATCLCLFVLCFISVIYCDLDEFINLNEVEINLPYLQKRTVNINGIETQPKLRILSIDGGGVKEIVTSQILVSLEEKIQQLTGDESANIGDYIDVIAGTSAGTTSALALLSGYNAKELLNIWETENQNIFGKKQILGGISKAEYNTKSLDNLLQKYFTDNMTLSSLENRSYAISAYDIGNQISGTFTRNSNHNRGDFLIWEAGKAGTAAPILFPSAEITSKSNQSFTFVDGGIGGGSPVIIALTAAYQDYGSQFSIPDTVVLSLGTGSDNIRVSGEQNWGAEQWVKNGGLNILFAAPDVGFQDQAKRIFDGYGVGEQFGRIQYDKQNPVYGPLSSCNSVSNNDADYDPQNIQYLEECGADLANQYETLIFTFAKYFTGLN